MNAVKKLAQKNIKRRQLGAGGVFMQMLEDGKSAKEIGEALGITEQKARELKFRTIQRITNADDCSASVTVMFEHKEEQHDD